ncbi:MAG: CDF family Co(II)/Ni(II) efflux transporter DmeF [Magnetococcales bacterium]|nr:CDF family Co(II)/Ni(II) efflux transporter DmeF [Magnetococcales bacterium]
MHIHTLDRWQHDHQFHLEAQEGERRTYWVVLLTAIMMVVEIVAGHLYGSMALLADGWHMGTHVAALSITLFAYRYTRQNASNPKYSFGTGKVNSLGGFASAVSLGVVALMIGADSLQRLFSPEKIHFNEAITVAIVGLIVNLVSAWLLHGSQAHDHHHHHHDHQKGDSHHHGHHDQNLRAAYLHVLADALTSVLAIVALLFGKSFGWIWMDAAMGLVGAVVISRWSISLLRETSSLLLDSTAKEEITTQIRETIESDADNRIADLHVWRVSTQHHAAILSLVTHNPQGPEHYKVLLDPISGLSHLTVEVNQCEGESCLR